VQAALAELRDLAHGIYPAILTEAGLGPALETLADDAPLPVENRELPRERFVEPVARAAYIAVSEALAGAAADHVEVDVQRVETMLLVDLRPIEAPLSAQAADRVGALGGTTSVEHGRLRIEIPCA
jgi:signal transduction histidine kinase